MSHISHSRSRGALASFAVLAFALTGCADRPAALPLAGQEAAPGSQVGTPRAAEVCGTEINPCVLEGITIVVPRAG